MSDALLWLALVEIIGLAAFPAVAILLPRLGDRGYGLAKVAGVLLLTYVNFISGSFAPLGNWPTLLWTSLVIFFVLGLVGLALRGENVVGLIRSVWRPALLAEAAFLVGFIVLALVRAHHPAIWHTEKPMDLSILTATHLAHTFPPYDPWLSGTTINYYYGGYLSMGTLLTLTGTAPAIGFNLALAVLCGLVLSSATSLGYSLTRHPIFALLSAAFIGIMGNLSAAMQFLSGKGGADAFDFFSGPTRITDNGLGINEFPAFSFMLGDMHPHVLTLPVALLAVGVAIDAAFHAPTATPTTAENNTPTVIIAETPVWQHWARIVFGGLVVGALYFMNSWDYPTYLLLVSGCWLLAGLPRPLRRETLDWSALLEATVLPIAAIALLSWLLYLPFRSNFHPTYGSFVIQFTRTPFLQIVEIFGLPLLAIAAFLAIELTGRYRRQSTLTANDARHTEGNARVTRPVRIQTAPAQRSGKDDDIPGIAGTTRDERDGPGFLDTMPAGNAIAKVLGTVFVFGVCFLIAPVPAVMLAGALCCGLLLWQVLRVDPSIQTVPAWAVRQQTALVIVLLGCLIAAGCDMIYLHDNFYGSAWYRMNTIFKFQYQTWVLLGLGGAYALWAVWQRLARQSQRIIWGIFCILLVLTGGLYPLLTIPSTSLTIYNGVADPLTLDGSAFLRPGDAADAAAIDWLNHAPAPTAVVVEATSNKEYWPYNSPPYKTVPANDPGQGAIYSRISTFTGRPTIMGWQNSHEGLWHGYDVIPQRNIDVQTIYTAPDKQTVLNTLKKYAARFVYLGPLEQQTYYGGIGSPQATAALTRLRHFLTPVYRNAGVTIFAVPF